MITDAEALIRREVEARGAIPFARFMELALYAPGVGYYERGTLQTGRRGDFYTSVSVGPVLGFLLAAWAATVGEGLEVVELVEAGAHDGQLAADILGALDAFHAATAERVVYRILEPSESRQAVQREKLAAWGTRVSWTEGWDGVQKPVRGLIISNELLDAMPVHRLVWDRGLGRWQEWGVTLVSGHLGWARMEADAELVPRELSPLTSVLPDGYVVERSPAAARWWRRAATMLERGRLMALDYGWDEEGGVRPERTNGTARAYRQHRLVEDLLASPGEQDLTAHVDFPGLVRAGEEAGLETLELLPQGRWLGRLAVEVFRGGGEAAAWLTERARGLQTLTHPGHLGHALRVLVQSREGG